MFHFDWDASEDTSKDLNPLYATRHDPKLLFGKGSFGGVEHEVKVKDKVDPRENIEEGKMVQERQNENHYLNVPKEQMTERDWRIFREDNDIQTRGSRIPQPLRNWDENEDIPP